MKVNGISYIGQDKKAKKTFWGNLYSLMVVFMMENFLTILYISKGTYVWGDQRKYFVTWKNDKMDGKGVFTLSDNRKYNWENKDDKKDSYDVFEWIDGRIYKVFWKNGKQEGKKGKF